MAVEQKIVKTPIKYKRNDNREELELEKNLKKETKLLAKLKMKKKILLKQNL